MTFLSLDLWDLFYMQGNYENLVKERFGETSTTHDDVAPKGEAFTQLVTPWISTVDDAKLFYKVVVRLKKG